MLNTARRKLPPTADSDEDTFPNGGENMNTHTVGHFRLARFALSAKREPDGLGDTSGLLID